MSLTKKEVKANADEAYIRYARLSKLGSYPGKNFDPKNGSFDIERDICKCNALEAHGEHVAYMNVYNAM
jgi:hypothetical protein